MSQDDGETIICDRCGAELRAAWASVSIGEKNTESARGGCMNCLVVYVLRVEPDRLEPQGKTERP